MIILHNVKIISMEGAGPACGDIAVDKGKIYEVAPEIVPAYNDEIIDMTGCTAMPGMIDAHCHIGMWEDGMANEGSDGNESTDPVTPQLRAIDGINPFDPCFKEAYSAGVTTVMTGPGSANVIGGQFVIMKTFGRCMEDMTVREPAALKAAFGENPKSVYGEKEHSPMTRMATAALLREAFFAARGYGLMRLKSDDGYDMRKQPVLDVLNGVMPLKCHAHRADDILTAIRIAKEFSIPYTLDHCTEGYLIADILKRENARVIIGPLVSERCKIELKNLSMENPRLLEQAGIEFAIMTDHPVVPIQYLPVTAALAVREGLSENAALRAITINAAKILGVDDRVGSIKAGKDADIAVFDGDPLDARSHAVLVMVNGKIAFKRQNCL